MTLTLDPRTYYLDLCREVTDELCRDLINYMIEFGCIGYANRVTRAHLASALLGKASSRNDRKIRKAKERLIHDRVPILSSSGTAGYYLAEYQDEIDDYVMENNNRIASLQEQVKAARKVRLPYRQPDHIEQLRCFKNPTHTQSQGQSRPWGG